MNSDLLDEWCELEFGHTNWSMDADDDGNVIIKFYAKPRENDENLEIEIDDISHINEGEQND